ncbi:MAG: endonuclease/exonuclease/phosphatase family protein [Treponemataceae bacterium]
MNVLKNILKCIGIIIAVLVALVLVLVLVFTLAEFKPKAEENVVTEGMASGTISVGSPFTIMSWNMGYGALGDNADFFMDGGTMVMSSEKDRVLENMEGLAEDIKEFNPDFVFLQEVDKKSKRSFKLDQKKFFENAFVDYESSFGTNFKVLHVPAPSIAGKNSIGSVDCGVLTLSKVASNSSTRISLPCPFNFPVRIFNLKRCLLINRIPVADTDKELVIVNLHLEAYDSGEGKIAQTKMLREIFDNEVAKGNYVIAGGDFNQTFSNVDLTNYPVLPNMWTPGIVDVSDFSEGIQLMMDAREPSCRSLDKVYEGADKDNFQFYVIDGFIVSSNVKINSFETVNKEFKNTDHNPVVMNVTLK